MSDDLISPLRRTLFLLLLVLVLVAPIAAPAAALEPFAAYPALPQGYSSIRVFDRNGVFTGRILSDRRYWVPIDRIPVFLQKALVAIEDSRFYEHNGIDVRGMARALVKDVVKRRLAEGGSTITQQLIKNKYLTAKKSLDRKLKEGLLAIDFEKKYSKKQILEMYFNEIYYGNGAWGIAQAARMYFDKNPEELTEAECVMLAGIPKNPGRYNPLGKPADVAKRRSLVLSRMAELNMISRAEEAKVRATPVTVTPVSQAPQYLAHLRAKLVERFGAGIVDQGGLEVTAAMDLKLQRLAEQVLREGVRRISPQLQGALLCLDPATGDVLAAAGGVDATATSYNRAFYAKRQPGSAIKPLIYAAALEKGFTPSSIVDDAPVAYPRGNGEVWKPENYAGEAFGEITLREALAHSDNVIAVKVLDAIGVPYFVDFAGKMGLRLRSPNDLSLALGTEEVTLDELVEAYTPLATGGLRADSRTIVRIYDRNRNAWVQDPPAVTPVLAPATAYVTTAMMKDVLTYGTAKGLKKFAQTRPAAGKTGTTSDYRDAWFVGYTPHLIAGVWVGYDKPRPGGRGFTGGAVSTPIWERFMKSALAGRPASDFPRPEGVTTAVIDPSTGLLATSGCPKKREEFYLPGTQPVDACARHSGMVLTPPAAPAAAPPAAAAAPLPAPPEAAPAAPAILR